MSKDNFWGNFIVILLSTISLILVIFTIISLINYSSKYKNYEKVEATVVEYVTNENLQKTEIVRFTAFDDCVYDITTDSYSYEPLPKNTVITIWYDRTNPTFIYLSKDYSCFVILGASVLSILGTIFAFYFFIIKYNKIIKSNQDYAQSIPQRVEDAGLLSSINELNIKEQVEIELNQTEISAYDRAIDRYFFKKRPHINNYNIWGEEEYNYTLREPSKIIDNNYNENIKVDKNQIAMFKTRKKKKQKKINLIEPPQAIKKSSKTYKKIVKDVFWVDNSTEKELSNKKYKNIVKEQLKNANKVLDESKK